jgi:hypothetical protein
MSLELTGKKTTTIPRVVVCQDFAFAAAITMGLVSLTHTQPNELHE